MYGGTYKCTGYYYVLNNFGKAYLKGGKFYCKNSSNSILATKGSVLQVNQNVVYSGDIDYE